MILLADCMDSSLDAVKRSITAAATNEFLVRAIFDNSATIQCNNAVNAAHGRKTMGNDEDSAPFGDPVHIFLDDPFALIIEGTGCLVEDQDARIGYESAGNGNALTLAAR